MGEEQWLQNLCGRLDRGEIDSALFLESFARELATHIGCSRAGVWVFVDTVEGRVLRCLTMYDAVRHRVVRASDMVNAEVGPYFEALLRDGCVVAADARTHPATVGFLLDYLLPLDVYSLMDVCYSVNGQVVGVFSCEQVGKPVNWSQRQVQTLRQIGARAALTLMHATQAASQTDTAPGALWEFSGPNRLTQPAPFDPDTEA